MENLEGEMQADAIQDELKPGGVFQNLPLEILKMILKNLPEREIRKTRRLSHWYEMIVTQLFPSLFHNFSITKKTFLFQKHKDNEIMAFLSIAMLKPHNKDNTLKLQFNRPLTPFYKEMLMSYQESIVALDIEIYGTGDEDFLIEPSIEFDLLESLSIQLKTGQHSFDQSFTEALIVKHASKLKKLSVRDHYKHIEAHDLFGVLNIPALPVIDSLNLGDIRLADAWPLIMASKQTITSLEIRGINMNIQPPINNAVVNEAASIYQVPNLQNLVIGQNIEEGSSSTMFLSHNANNLVSLTLMGVNVNSSTDLPGLPELRELTISGSGGNSAHVFTMCKESLKCLVYNDYDFEIDYYAVVMPQLTELYLNGAHECSRFLSYNHKSLQFLFLINFEPKEITLVLDVGVKMERVKTVVLKTYYDISEDDREKMNKLWPNAEILIWNDKNKDEMKDYVISHHRRRGFTSDLNDLFGFNLR